MRGLARGTAARPRTLAPCGRGRPPPKSTSGPWQVARLFPATQECGSQEEACENKIFKTQGLPGPLMVGGGRPPWRQDRRLTRVLRKRKTRAHQRGETRLRSRTLNNSYQRDGDRNHGMGKHHKNNPQGAHQTSRTSRNTHQQQLHITHTQIHIHFHPTTYPNQHTKAKARASTRAPHGKRLE